jgi:hypothetical protein
VKSAISSALKSAKTTSTLQATDSRESPALSSCFCGALRFRTKASSRPRSADETERDFPRAHCADSHVAAPAGIPGRTQLSGSIRWQERFLEEGFDGLLRDKTRPSRIKPLGAEAAERVVALTLAEPPGETTHWTSALMAKAAGLSVSSVQRIWRAHGLQPHRVRQFKLVFRRAKLALTQK